MNNSEFLAEFERLMKEYVSYHKDYDSWLKPRLQELNRKKMANGTP